MGSRPHCCGGEKKLLRMRHEGLQGGADTASLVAAAPQVGWEIYFGAFAGAFPFAIGLYEFTKRIVRAASRPPSAHARSAPCQQAGGDAGPVPEDGRPPLCSPAQMIQRRCKVCKGSGLVVAGSRQLEVHLARPSRRCNLAVQTESWPSPARPRARLLP